MVEISLQNIKCFLLDMDGTFFISDHLLPGAVQFLNLLKEKKIPFYFLTNNSSKDKNFYFRKLNRLGLKVDRERIFTSGEATAIYLNQYYCNAKVYAVATPELEHELEMGGVKLTKVNPDIVVLGYDTSLTYDKLAKFCEFVSTESNILLPAPM
jgi:HAD superfamily hydrolase (TIGR01450 family)